MMRFLVGGEGLEPPEAERPSRLQRDVIATIRTAHTSLTARHFASAGKYPGRYGLAPLLSNQIPCKKPHIEFDLGTLLQLC